MTPPRPANGILVRYLTWEALHLAPEAEQAAYWRALVDSWREAGDRELQRETQADFEDDRDGVGR